MKLVLTLVVEMTVYAMTPLLQAPKLSMQLKLIAQLSTGSNYE